MGKASTAKNTREKAAQMRAEAERAQARRRNVIVGVSVIAVLIVLIGGYAGIRTLQNQQAEKEAAASAPPANIYKDPANLNGYLYGKQTAANTLVVYEDFICPACKSFETADKALVRGYADAGKIKIIYRPVAILDQNSTTNYSSRAGAAAGAVLNVAPDKFIAFHDALFENQPEEGGPGLPDSALVDLAVKQGVDKAKVEPLITSQKFSGWMKKATVDFSKTYNSTPTLVLNGKKLESYDPAALKAAIDKLP